MATVTYTGNQVHRKYRLCFWEEKVIDPEEASDFLDKVCGKLKFNGLSLTKKALGRGGYEIDIDPSDDIRILPANIDEIVKNHLHKYFRAIPVQG